MDPSRSPGLEPGTRAGTDFSAAIPAGSDGDGPIEIAGEPVKIYYKPPASIAPKVGGVTLHTSVTSPTAMTLVGDAWEATIPPQEHGTRVEWYLEALIDGVLCRDPLSGEYSYVAFAHFNPYANGLPEMMDAWRKGTDRYLFDATECIQPELINLCRYVLDGIGRLLRHSPARAGVNNACCLKFRLSGDGAEAIAGRCTPAGSKRRGALHNPMRTLTPVKVHEPVGGYPPMGTAVDGLVGYPGPAMMPGYHRCRW